MTGQRNYSILVLAASMAACATTPPPPDWNPVTPQLEAQYDAYADAGTNTLTGQAFLNQRGGNVVRAAGQTVTLDPATDIGHEWWARAGRMWIHRTHVPPSAAFLRSRRETVADADGRFRFTSIPAGRYYVRTEVTWEVPSLPLQGGLVGRMITVRDQDQPNEVVLNQVAK